MKTVIADTICMLVIGLLCFGLGANWKEEQMTPEDHNVLDLIHARLADESLDDYQAATRESECIEFYDQSQDKRFEIVVREIDDDFDNDVQAIGILVTFGWTITRQHDIRVGVKNDLALRAARYLQSEWDYGAIVE